MLKLPKGLKKKKKKSKKDQELFTEEELKQYKRELKAKQEAEAAKSDAGESDAASDAEGLSTATAHISSATTSAAAAGNSASTTGSTEANDTKAHEADEEWAKFKALTSGVDSILHKTQDELDRIKKESFYQRLPSAAEKKRQEEEEAAKREAERLEEERRKAAEVEAKRDKLAEAVVVLSDSEDEDSQEADDIFATDYIEKITSGEVQLGVVPDSPELELNDGPDPFDTAYAEQVIVGANKAKGNKKLVSLGAAVEVLSGRVEREHALSLSKPKRKQRKGIQNLLLSESVDLTDEPEENPTLEPQKNLLDELFDDIPNSDVPIDLSVSLDLHLRPTQPKVQENETEDEDAVDLSAFDTLQNGEDDEFAELAAESLTKKEEVTVITQITLPQPEILSEVVEGDWAEFEQVPEEQPQGKPSRPPPPRPTSELDNVTGAIFISDDEEDNLDDDPFNTTYAEQVIKKTTVLEEDDEFDPRAEEKKPAGPPPKPPPPAAHLLRQPQKDLLGGSSTDLSTVGATPIAPQSSVANEEDADDFDPFDTSRVSAIVQPKTTELKILEKELLTQSNLKHSLSDPDFDPRADETPEVAVSITTDRISVVSTPDFDIARRKSSLSLTIQSKTVGFVVPAQDLLNIGGDSSKVQKPLTPYYAPASKPIVEKEPDDPFDTSYVPDSQPTQVELKNLEKDLLEKEISTLTKSLSDPDFDPRAPVTPAPVEDLLTVENNIDTKVLTPAQERKNLSDGLEEILDPFDTSSIAANIQPGRAELKLLESELLPDTKPVISTGVLDTQTDAQELGLGDKVLTPSVLEKQVTLPEEIDPFDTSIAENLQPGETEIKLLESELIQN